MKGWLGSMRPKSEPVAAQVVVATHMSQMCEHTRAEAAGEGDASILFRLVALVWLTMGKEWLL